MIEILKFIYKHPLNKNDKIGALMRFIKWQFASRIWSAPLLFKWIGDSKLLVSNGMTGATGNIYVGLMEYQDMSFLLHYLNKDDLFFDIGANVGVYTVLASKVKEANTVSFEPLPTTYEKLLDNINLNRLDNAIALNIGLSSERTQLYFTTDKDTMNSVAGEHDKNKIKVDVETLDNICKIYGYPKAIKIDVEGYETNVLNGANEVLMNENLEVLIIELNGSGGKFGYSDDTIHTRLLKNGFKPFSYDPFAKNLYPLNTYGTHNTIYIKQCFVKKIQNILTNAEAFRCGKEMI